MLKNSGHQFKMKCWSWNVNLPTWLTANCCKLYIREDQMVGHVPFNLAPSISLFSRRYIKQAFAKVGLERKLNRGAGYGLEIPCMELLVDSLNSTCTCIDPTSRLNVKNLLTTTYCLLSESLTWKFSCLHVHLQSHVLIVLNFMGVVSWVSVI